VDKNDKKTTPFAQPMDSPVSSSDMKELARRLRPEMRRGQPGADAVSAALEAAQRLAVETDAEDAANDVAQGLSSGSKTVACKICGYENRAGNKFCGMCGISAEEAEKAAANIPSAEPHAPSTAMMIPQTFPEPEMRLPMTRPTGNETHHYHHHYHHHYFPGAQEGMVPRASEPVRDPAREDKLRATAASLRGDMSRAESAVRAITHEWVLACNTKHLDDLLELYTSDALVLRSNYPPIRGAAAVREFFFGALDAGLGEVEIEPLRVEVAGDLAYEAGRCKALIPGSTGKRREERGKYLWVLARQPNGEWKVTADCWSSDLTLTTLESDVPTGAGVKTAQPRKNP
jgi:ketosteroid isomerase-like protein